MGRILKHRKQRRAALKNKTPGMSRALLEQVGRQGFEPAQGSPDRSSRGAASQLTSVKHTGILADWIETIWWAVKDSNRPTRPSRRDKNNAAPAADDNQSPVLC
jgi:hypothetical protein